MLPRLLLSLLMLAATPWAALAQEAPWPNRPITILGGFPNGAGTEIYARRLSDPPLPDATAARSPGSSRSS